MENPNPEVEDVQVHLPFDSLTLIDLEKFPADSLAEYEPVSVSEVFALVKDIRDPEHADLTLAQLRVVRIDQIQLQDGPNGSHVVLEYTPTIPTCSVAVLIGLTLLRKLQLCLPMRFKVAVRISPGKHVQEKQVNKQLSDKERVAAAVENPNLSKLVRDGVYKTDTIPDRLLIW